MKKLNLWCGNFKIEWFINVDADESVNPDLVSDILNLPYEDNSVEEIYAWHILEHLAEPSVLLKEINRVLIPWGKCTITVPDTEKALQLYNDWLLSLDMVQQIVYGEKDRHLQYHFRVFNESILKMFMNEVFKDCSIQWYSELAPYNGIPWQTICIWFKK